MIKCLECINWKHVAVFAGRSAVRNGRREGSWKPGCKEGLCELRRAAGLRAKECVMTTAVHHSGKC